MTIITAAHACKKLRAAANPAKSATIKIFFKKSRNDIFLGVSAPVIRKIAKELYEMKLTEIVLLMRSRVHDERCLAHAILCIQFRKGDDAIQEKIYRFYIKNKKTIRDWAGVDDSAPYIMGPYLLARDKTILYDLAVSDNIWDRRIAIVCTLHFIRQNQLRDTFKLAEILLQDEEDLIQKAVGWMLREAGKRNVGQLKTFLKRHHANMPRTMLRYAIERFSQSERAFYLKK